MESKMMCSWCGKIRPVEGARWLTTYVGGWPEEGYKCRQCQFEDGDLIFARRKKGGPQKRESQSFGLVELGNKRRRA